MELSRYARGLWRKMIFIPESALVWLDEWGPNGCANAALKTQFFPFCFNQTPYDAAATVVDPSPHKFYIRLRIVSDFLSCAPGCVSVSGAPLKFITSHDAISQMSRLPVKTWLHFSTNWCQLIYKICVEPLWWWADTNFHQPDHRVAKLAQECLYFIICRGREMCMFVL